MDESKSQFATIDEYIAAFPEAVQEKLRALRQVIKGEAPDAQEAISYGMPTFKLNGNLVHFAAFKTHIGLYPATGSMDDSEVEGLSAYRSGKGTFQFPIDEPLPLPMIRHMVAIRAQQNRAKKKKG
jgi:uncharacterized protein YdhG (YjbR/CyaY superfamily)